MGYVFALISTACWSVNLVLARALNQSIDPISLAFLRWLVAVLAFSPFALPSFIRSWSAVRRRIPYLLVTGVLGIALFSTLVCFAGRTTEAINLSLITMTFPIFVLLLSRIFLKEPVGWIRSLGVLTVFAGLLLLISDGDFRVILSLSFTPGDMLVLLASLVFATYSMLVRRRPPELGHVVFQYSTFLVGLFVLIPLFRWCAGPRAAAGYYGPARCCHPLRGNLRLAFGFPDLESSYCPSGSKPGIGHVLHATGF